MDPQQPRVLNIVEMHRLADRLVESGVLGDEPASRRQFVSSLNLKGIDPHTMNLSQATKFFALTLVDYINQRELSQQFLTRLDELEQQRNAQASCGPNVGNTLSEGATAALAQIFEGLKQSKRLSPLERQIVLAETLRRIAVEVAPSES
jgi:hypothetical protein